MYRRVNSGRFIAFATVGIVIVMAVFTWVMYGMAQKVFVMTDVMIELNESFKSMVGTQTSMAADMHSMSINMASMNTNVASMATNIAEMNGEMGALADNIVTMSKTMQIMTVNMNRLSQDIGQASYAFSQPMSYMWGNAFPF